MFIKKRSKFKKPEIGEGFSEVVLVKFIGEFETEKDRELYSKFLC